MKHLRWLNPLLWFWAVYYGITALRLLRSVLKCPDCERTLRGKPLPWDNLCTYHQERYRAAHGEAVETRWREWWG